MHQTFYIDIDEEITSIVDRLRKAKSKEVVIVVPKRAILIQSIINLKLLKKEADSVRKNIIIVTQDKFGKMLIEKAGMTVEQKLDDIAGQEIIEPEEYREDEFKINPNSDQVGFGEVKKNKRLDKIGSDGYYQGEEFDAVLGRDAYLAKKESMEVEAENSEIITNKELVIDMGDDLKRQQPSFQKNVARKGNYAPMDMIRNVEIAEEGFVEDEPVIQPIKKTSLKNTNNLFKQEEIHAFTDNSKGEDLKMKKANGFFEHKKSSNADEYKSINVGNSVWKYFLIFSFIVAITIAGSAAYVFLPKASVLVFVKNKTQTIDSQIDGKTSVSTVDLANEIIPAKIVSVSADLTINYDTTGSKNSSSQKARGTITIYNEFSSSPQPLIATTRFESADKKIFRLVSGVTVPGMEKAGTPGAIEAAVIADESGDQYNIDATSFTIPGFQSSGADKYAKIYAKSFKSMTGGGQSNQTVQAITDADINSAKTKVAQELRPQMNQKLKDEAGDGFVVLDDATNIDDASYTLSKSPGDIANNFSITVTMKASAIVFSSDDVKNIVAISLAKKGDQNMTVAKDSINLEFGKTDINFKDGTLVIRVHSSGKIVPNIDLEKLKQDILGKQEEELKPYLSAYPDIERVEVSYWPSFISGKIPNYARQVDITLI
jgi:Pyruvate/2-oxoacid:ferredoxin oxidoreductase gamma subunit